MTRIIEFKDNQWAIENSLEPVQPPNQQTACIASLEAIARRLSSQDIRSIMRLLEKTQSLK